MFSNLNHQSLLMLTYKSNGSLGSSIEANFINNRFKMLQKIKLIYKICNRLERNYSVKIVIAKCFFFFCQNSLIIFLDHCKPTVFSVLPEYKLSSISHKSQFQISIPHTDDKKASHLSLYPYHYSHFTSLIRTLSQPSQGSDTLKEPLSKQPTSLQ